jgi:hypothetical protein
MAVLLFATSLGSELTGVHGVGAAPRQHLLAAILYMLDCRIIQALPICFLLKDFFFA